MKKLSTLLTVLLVALFVGAVAFAGTCPRLVHQIDNKLSSMSVSADKAAQIKAMRDKGAQLHEEGKHGPSVAVLKEALEMLEN